MLLLFFYLLAAIDIGMVLFTFGCVIMVLHLPLPPLPVYMSICIYYYCVYLTDNSSSSVYFKLALVVYTGKYYDISQTGVSVKSYKYYLVR